MGEVWQGMDVSGGPGCDHVVRRCGGRVAHVFVGSSGVRSGCVREGGVQQEGLRVAVGVEGVSGEWT